MMRLASIELIGSAERRDEIREASAVRVARLLGMELHADDAAALDGGGERRAVCRRRHAVAGHRRGVASA